MKQILRSVLGLVVASTSLAGCSSDPPRYAVSGVVKINGLPAPYVLVRFLPAVAGSLAGGVGTTDQAGKFAIGEDGKNTGFPAGDYKVTFSQTLVGGKPTLAGSGGKAAERELSEREAVADDFRDPSKTPILATIGGAGADPFTFDIKSKK